MALALRPDPQYKNPGGFQDVTKGMNNVCSLYFFLENYRPILAPLIICLKLSEPVGGSLDSKSKVVVGGRRMQTQAVQRS